MNKPKLLFVLHALNVGGTEVIVKELIEYQKDNFQIEVLTLDSFGVIAEEILKLGINVHCLHRQEGSNLANLKLFHKKITEINPDLVHAHQYSPYFYAACCKLFYYKTYKLIFTEHGRHYPDCVSLPRKFINVFLQAITNQITACCEFTTTALRRKELIYKKIELIYNGREQAEVSNISAVDLGLPTDKRLILYLGSFRKVKNPLLLLRAYLQIRDEFSDLCLVFAGRGELKAEIEELITEYSLNEEVVLIGEMFPATPLFSHVDCFVQPSLSEANSLALLEAQSFGIPCIVSDYGGGKEVVQHDKNGLLFKSQDVNSLAEQLRKVLRDRNFAKSIGEEAKVIFKKRFLSSIMNKNYHEKVYKHYL